MPLHTCQPVGFIPTRNAGPARLFYENTLGLHFETDDGFALVFRLGPEHATMLRLVRVGPFASAPFTIFGWEVTRIEACVEELSQRGVSFVRIPALEQDSQGIWTSPGGSKIAWFKDPDGNTLSLSEHAQ